MSLWPEDFSTCTLEEVLSRQAQNRAWSREIRLSNSALVNQRLAKSISQPDYVANREVVRGEASECQRRARILENQIASRSARNAPRHL
jgi:hypothetical protein